MKYFVEKLSQKAPSQLFETEFQLLEAFCSETVECMSAMSLSELCNRTFRGNFRKYLGIATLQNSVQLLKLPPEFISLLSLFNFF